MSDYSTVFEKIEGHIRAGESAVGLRLFSRIPLKTIPARQVLRAAQLAQRLNRIKEVLKLLHSRIRPAPAFALGGTDEEKMEYALALFRSGARPEAMRILYAVQDQRVPRWLSYRAHFMHYEWDYESSIPLLRDYLAIVPPADYGYQVAQLNLLSALIFVNRPEDRDERENLHDNLEATFDPQTRRLFCLQLKMLRIQQALLDGDRKAAESALEQTQKLNEQSSEFDKLFYAKWRAMKELSLSDSSSSLAELMQVRAKAISLGHWETVRDCDRSLFLYRQDRQAFERVYFGTPYPAYRNALLRESAAEGISIATHLWNPGAYPEAERQILDLEAATLDGKALDFERGSVTHRLLKALLHDFYRPAPLAFLFSALYPDEVFNPNTSLSKTKQVLGRLGKSIQTGRWRLKLVLQESGYRLFSEGCCIFLRAEKKVLGQTEYRLEHLRSWAKASSLTREEVEKILGLSRATAVRFINTAVEGGHLEKEGKGKVVRYRFKKL